MNPISKGNDYASQRMKLRAYPFVLVPFVITVILMRAPLSVAQQGTPLGNAPMSYSIVENLEPGVFVASIATDAKLSETLDQNTTSSLHFEVLKGSFRDYFSVESPSGLLKTERVIDRDSLCPKQAACVLSIDVAIIRPPQKFRVFKLDVTIVDVNDNTPMFEPPSTTISVSESAHQGTVIVLPTAEDLDSGPFDVQEYTFASNSSKFELRVTRNPDGTHDLRLVVVGRLDRELEDRYIGKVSALDGGNPAQTGTLDVTILIQDANDNQPVFDRSVYNVSVREDFPLNGILVWVHATDADTGLNGEVVYGFARQTQAAFGAVFSIDPQRGDVVLKQGLDYEAESIYNLLVVAMDSGPDAMPVYTKVIIVVEDLNDNAPIIRTNAVDNNGFAEIAENEPIMSFVAHISAEDPDSELSGEVNCELLQGKGFGLQQLYVKEFKLVTTTVFDREQQDQYSVTVLCHDNGNPSLSTSKDIVIKVTDSNDNAPEFDQKSYLASVREGNALGVPLLRVNASDADVGANAVIEYSLCPDAKGIVSVDNSTGLLTAGVAFDYEKAREVRLCVVAADKGPLLRLSSSVIVTVSVVDVNDEAPMFGQQSYTFGTYENQPPNSEIGTVSAADADHHPFDRFIFSLVKERPELDSFSIDPYSGRITTTKLLDREQCAAHYLTVAATNVAFPNPSSSANVTVYVADRNDNAPHVDFPTRENNTVEVSLYTPIGSTFTRIYASDSDSGINSKLNYAIAKGNGENCFDIDPIAGTVSVNKDLTERQDSEQKTFRLIIAVSDSGVPPKSSDVVLNVVLTSSPSLGNLIQYTATGLELTSHRKILILVGGVTAVLVSILITSIVCIKWRQAVYNRRFRRYWPTRGERPTVAGSGSEESRYLNISDCYTAMKDGGQDPKNVSSIYRNLPVGNSKNVHFDMSMDAVDDRSQNLTNQHQKMKRSCNTNNRNKTLPSVVCYERADVHIPAVVGPCLDNNQMSLMPGLGNQDAIDSDSTSGCSTDMSNSDTGRGGGGGGGGHCDCCTANLYNHQRHHHRHHHCHRHLHVGNDDYQDRNFHQLSDESVWECSVPESCSEVDLKGHRPPDDMQKSTNVPEVTCDTLQCSTQDEQQKREGTSPSVEHSSQVNNPSEQEHLIAKSSAEADVQDLDSTDCSFEVVDHNIDQQSKIKPAVPPRNTSLQVK